MTTAGDDLARPLRGIDRTNIILYCRHWHATTRFYRDDLELPVVHTTEWFVEFHLTGESYLSIADAPRRRHVRDGDMTAALDDAIDFLCELGPHRRSIGDPPAVQR
ncbi:MAG: hypothetical protein KY460_01830 [Actinobacteria bacterium]|nr:hypothetical protein [Actinomycetota bacterium]